MGGRVIYSPTQAHRCFYLFPAEAGLFATGGTRWRCDGCGTVWELTQFGWTIVPVVSPREGTQNG